MCGHAEGQRGGMGGGAGREGPPQAHRLKSYHTPRGAPQPALRGLSGCWWTCHPSCCLHITKSPKCLFSTFSPQVVGSQARILYSDQKGRVAIAVAFNQAIARGEIKVTHSGLQDGGLPLSPCHQRRHGPEAPWSVFVSGCRADNWEAGVRRLVLKASL